MPVCSRTAGRTPTRSRRSQGRGGLTWRRGERSPSSRMLARGGRNGPPGHEASRLDRSKALEGRSPGEQRPRFVASATGRGTASRGDQSFEAAEAGRRSSQVGGRDPGAGEADAGARARAVETVLSAPVGNQATALHGAGVGETRSDTVTFEPWELTVGGELQGSTATPRGARDPGEEQGSEGRTPRAAAA